jgi:hypothetical protein
MTIAMIVKIGDGLVLGSDSASTFIDAQGSWHNSYFNAEKLFNLVKGLPVGAVTAGLGSLDGRSISNLSKELRARLCDLAKPEWYLNPQAYTIEDVANRMKAFFFDEYYKATYGTLEPTEAPGLNFLVGGYGAGQRHSEVWSVDVAQGQCTVGCVGDSSTSGVQWIGMREALDRLVRGYSATVYAQLVKSGVPEAEAAAFLSNLPVAQLVNPGMPLQDAIDLVNYLVEVTNGFVRFAPGAPAVHPPTDIAAITPHEGFRWVQRKHYFKKDLNEPIDRYPLRTGQGVTDAQQ